MSVTTETPTPVKLSPAERFASDTAEHEMTVLHNDGLYRHLRFQQPDRSFYWFDLISVPGTLIFQGDGDSFVFSRTKDMFEFFRMSGGQINPGYWSEKLTSRHDRAMKYDEDLLTAQVQEDVAQALRDDPTLIGLADAVRSEILEDGEIFSEDAAVHTVANFTFYKKEQDRYNSDKLPDFQFVDCWEWNCRDYDWWFLWACHAIVWGITQFDKLVKQAA